MRDTIILELVVVALVELITFQSHNPKLYEYICFSYVIKLQFYI